jgi:hypothetical protein
MIYLPSSVVDYIHEFMIRKYHYGALVRQIVQRDFINVLDMLLFQYSRRPSALTNESDDGRWTEITRTLCPNNKTVTFTELHEPFLGVWRRQCSYYTYEIGRDAHCCTIYDDRVRVAYSTR